MASLLLSAVAMDQECNTGLPTQLFDSAMATFQTIQRQFHAERANRYLPFVQDYVILLVGHHGN